MAPQMTDLTADAPNAPVASTGKPHVAPPAVPEAVAAAYAAMPPQAQPVLAEARKLLFQVASESGAGPLDECLKWGEPAYLTAATKSGTTLRLAMVEECPAALVNCRTSLIAELEATQPGVLATSGRRGVLLRTGYDRAALAVFFGRALLYHRGRRMRRAS
ncbi:hypothetical protein [Pseudooceanicola aestuarii]|uniref:hypothetical protein n=1 Tax=Pseudooceanicola aestuarii TaxID=2697319 RepID=UPI0019546E58|nr:hypothetical protein [Pseudooceanicola aestuarii]